MNATETAKLCDIIRSLSPAAGKSFTEDTPAIWFAVLADVLYADALEAVKRLARRTPWIGTAEICGEVAALRKARLEAADAADELVPNVDPDDTHAYNRERRAIMRAVADGAMDIDAYTRGGFTLTGVEPRRPVAELGTGDPAAVQEVLRNAVALTRVPRTERAERRGA